MLYLPTAAPSVAKHLGKMQGKIDPRRLSDNKLFYTKQFLATPLFEWGG